MRQAFMNLGGRSEALPSMGRVGWGVAARLR